jgi:uncharacterized protein (DUF1697 family)
MTTHVALLRAINVAGHNKVSMAELRGLLAELGFANVQSLLQSGNLVFDSRAGTPARLESTLEQASRDRLQLETAFFARTARSRRRSSPATRSPMKRNEIPTTWSSSLKGAGS